METAASTSASPSPTAEGLRQRQRDRLSPRGHCTKPIHDSTAVREVNVSWKVGVIPSPARKTIATARTQSKELLRNILPQEEFQKENSASQLARREAEGSRRELVPDRGSAGRGGRQFTVAKVGNNGRIYLRPTIRPAGERYPQPAFTFPMTPPSTAGFGALVSRSLSGDTSRDSLWTPSTPPSSPVGNGHNKFSKSNCASRRMPQKRAHSCSTLNENYSAAMVADKNTFKVVIEKPERSTKHEALPDLASLKVPIPSYKLGMPRFTATGTPLLSASSYTTSDEIRSSIMSGTENAGSLSSHRQIRIHSRRHSDTSPHPQKPGIALSSSFDATYHPVGFKTCAMIVPEIFDMLTFKPSCDHASVVRYSSNEQIKSATPARLVAEITSPSFVDYDLLSDFFLTFRSFLDTPDLLQMLIARLRWAFMRSDSIGTVVRVRTFVALRHWILNYFLDDFVVDWQLRKSFCDMLNNFVDNIGRDPLKSRAPMKILGELKRCWRRVCALYWDIPEFENQDDPMILIVPGGVAGSRNANLDPSFWEKDTDKPPRLDGIIEPDFTAPTITVKGRNYFADVSQAGHLNTVIIPHSASNVNISMQEAALSPTSEVSEDFVSCSFPCHHRGSENTHTLSAHPVPAGSMHESGNNTTSIPTAIFGKHPRPEHGHQRSTSFSDSYRDHRVPQQPIHKVIYKSTELLLALPYAGSLVRGNLFPPGKPFVDMIAPDTPMETNRATTVFPGTSITPKGSSTISAPGMKKLLGSVRRVLSSRTGLHPNISPTQESFPHLSPSGVRRATMNRLPGTAIVPQARNQYNSPHTPMRIDLLGAEVAEHFKKAVEEDAEAEAEAKAVPDQQDINTNRPSSQNSAHISELQYSVLHPGTTLESSLHALQEAHEAPFSDITTGCQSTVIVNDGLSVKIPGRRRASGSRSVETFVDNFVQPSSCPTPPSTPPDSPSEPIVNSSGHVRYTHRKDSNSFDKNPSPYNSRPSKEDEQSSNYQICRNLPLQPLRGLSSKTKRSFSLRSYASCHSNFKRPRSERSFDATTLSEDQHEEVKSSSQAGSMVLPSRRLRRRPGGNLRSASRVGDLNPYPLRRPISIGPLSGSYSESMRTSYLIADDLSQYVNVENSDNDQPDRDMQVFSLGQMAEPLAKRHMSIFSTPSSQPDTRPSFEKEAQMLAQIPDDDEDDGGVESALMKLEGKFEKRQSDTSRLSHSRGIPETHHSFGAYDLSTLSFTEDKEEKQKHRHKHTLEATIPETGPRQQSSRPQQNRSSNGLKPAVYQSYLSHDSFKQLAQSLKSIESYNSTPLLERGLVHDEHDRIYPHHFQQPISLYQSIEKQQHHLLPTPRSPHINSFDLIDQAHCAEVTSKLHRAQPSCDESLLDFKSDNQSDLSSEMSLEMVSHTDYVGNESGSTNGTSFPPIRAGTIIKELTHPLRHPSSPSLTMMQALVMSPEAEFSAEGTRRKEIATRRLLHHTISEASPQTISAGTPLVEKGVAPSMNSPRSHKETDPCRKTSIHLPFILAFDSQILAQQFTLIEKEALNEIDWKDLIEMRWKESSMEVRSWVEFLRSPEPPRGVEVVIARFNLMVKWTVSQCVLTADLNERVQCIIKYIHIAAHCRKYRNFATMTQIIVALTSKDVARLTKTWVHVPATDIQTLHDLEALVTPKQNFYNLRAEMEGAGAGQGCIPFIGIYTHDLLVNYERPSQIASTPTTEPLVNFEKYRIDAMIVKNLLRLIEASQLFRFLPIEGVTERCLWMAALSDHEILKYGLLIQE